MKSSRASDSSNQKLAKFEKIHNARLNLIISQMKTKASSEVSLPQNLGKIPFFVVCVKFTQVYPVYVFNH